jgi:hypothetical protein
MPGGHARVILELRSCCASDDWFTVIAESEHPDRRFAPSEYRLREGARNPYASAIVMWNGQCHIAAAKVMDSGLAVALRGAPE